MEHGPVDSETYDYVKGKAPLTTDGFGGDTFKPKKSKTWFASLVNSAMTILLS